MIIVKNCPCYSNGDCTNSLCASCYEMNHCNIKKAMARCLESENGEVILIDKIKSCTDSQLTDEGILVRDIFNLLGVEPMNWKGVE